MTLTQDRPVPGAPAAVPGTLPVEAGRAHPPGATPDAGGVNFSLFADEATGVTLLLFAAGDAPQPAQAIPLDPAVNRTFGFWHVRVNGLGPGAHYAYRVDGPRGADDLRRYGRRFDPGKVLVDPYARGLTKALWRRTSAIGPGDNVATSMRGVVLDGRAYDWEGDRPLGRPLQDSVIYEMHVAGFTRSPTSGAARPGTFAGVVERIPHLLELGVTAVELLPIATFDELELDRNGPDGAALVNYWGYSPVGFFAPHDRYCVRPDEGSHLDELRDMVKALHRAGIEVILDVVFNHTGENDERGPTISFRGIGNDLYYFLDPSDRARYLDYSGCGNTLDCNHPVVEKLVVDCLEYWVRELHVDGFRFDEGSILSRGPDGAPLEEPPVLWQIELSEALADTKIIAEAWDAAGLYQVGSFPGLRWSTWNGRFRDDVRRFVRGDRGLVAAVASRVAGSSDLYPPGLRLPINGINFVTCHDGFTLHDLVCYDAKHNEVNGEQNRDGIGDNASWNCGVEGPTDDRAVLALRERQVRNLAAILLLSRGVPMVLAGDEVGRTQRGNNNAYCQDNEISWFDWSLVDTNRALLRFFRELIALRARHPALRAPAFYTGSGDPPDIAWHGCLLGAPGFGDPASGVLAFTIAGAGGAGDLHVMMNMEPGPLDFEVPARPGGWLRLVDTARTSPDDIRPLAEAVSVGSPATQRVESHSVVVLAAR
jgi:glycogen operon protein